MTVVDFKHHPLAVSAYRAYQKATTCRVRSWVFVASTGRSGTESLRRILEAVDRSFCCHEPFPVMRDARPDDEAPERYFRRRFRTLKSIYVRRAGHRCRHYFETNHQFIKRFAGPAVEEFGRRLKVIHLRRDPVSVALSFCRLDSIPGRSDRGRLWLLDPSAADNVIRLDDLLAPGGPFDTDVHRCLWYWYEIEARVRWFRSRHPQVPVVDLWTEELNDLDALRTMFRNLAVPVDDARLRRVVGTHANTKASERRGIPSRGEAAVMDLEIREAIRGRYPGLLERAMLHDPMSLF